MPRRRDAVVRRGLRHIGRAVSEQRAMFTLALLGSSLYAGMTVASAYVIGGITDRVLLPSFEDGATTAAALTLRERPGRGAHRRRLPTMACRDPNAAPPVGLG